MSESTMEKRPMRGTAALEHTGTELKKNPGGNERYVHYVRKDRITAPAATGRAVVALRGKVWVPMRDSKNFSICPVCKEVMNSMYGGGSDNPGWLLAGN